MNERYYILNLDDIEVYKLQYDAEEYKIFKSNVERYFKIPKKTVVDISLRGEEIEQLLCKLNLMDKITKYKVLRKNENHYRVKIEGYNYPVLYHILNNNKAIYKNENMSTIEAIYRWQKNEPYFKNLKEENFEIKSDGSIIYDPMIEAKYEIVEDFFGMVSLEKTNSYNKKQFLKQLSLFVDKETIEEKFGNIQDEAIKNFYIMNEMFKEYNDFGHGYAADSYVLSKK